MEISFAQATQRVLGAFYATSSFRLVQRPGPQIVAAIEAEGLLPIEVFRAITLGCRKVLGRNYSIQNNKIDRPVLSQLGHFSASVGNALPLA